MAALSAIPAAIAPVAQADVCGDIGGRHVTVGGCTPGIAGDAPCISPTGLPYSTPADAPCFAG